MSKKYLLIRRGPRSDFSSWARVFELRSNGLAAYWRKYDTIGENYKWACVQTEASMDYIQCLWDTWDQDFLTEAQFQEFIGRIFLDLL